MAISTSASFSMFVLSSPPSVRSTASSAFVEIPNNGVLSRTTRAPSHSQIVGPSHKSMAVTVRSSMGNGEQLNSGSVDGEVDLFRSKLRASSVPSVDELADLLKSIAGEKQYSKVISLYEEMKTSEVSPNTRIMNIVMDCYCKLNNTDSALELLREMKGSKSCKPDAVTYNTLIKWVFKRTGNTDAALELLRKMKAIEKCKTEVNTYNTLIGELCETGNADAALELLRKMKEGENCEPGVVTYTTLIAGFCKIGNTLAALDLVREMAEEEMEEEGLTR